MGLLDFVECKSRSSSPDIISFISCLTNRSIVNGNFSMYSLIERKGIKIQVEDILFLTRSSRNRTSSGHLRICSDLEELYIAGCFASKVLSLGRSTAKTILIMYIHLALRRDSVTTSVFCLNSISVISWLKLRRVIVSLSCLEINLVTIFEDRPSVVKEMILDVEDIVFFC